MTSIPENLAQIAPILTQYLSPLLLWFSNHVYDRLIPTDSNHLLFRLHNLLDFSPLESACAAYHKSNGRGHPVVHSVPRLLRAICVKYLFACSLRELEHKIRYDLFVKWFVGYPIFAAGPDHSTLERFESFLSSHHPRLFFDTILNQIDAAFPADRGRPQVGDTFAMLANAALESIIKRLRHTVQQMLIAFQAANPDAYAQLWSQLDEQALFGEKDEMADCYLSTSQWQQRLVNTAESAWTCLHLLQQSSLPPAVLLWTSRLQKIFTDEFCLDESADGCLSHISLLSSGKRGKFRICSATDPEATIRNHGPSKKEFGYNVSVVTTSHFIREIQADTGSRPDADPIPELLLSQIEHHHLCPDKFIYDQAAGWGKTAFLVDKATGGRTQLVAKPIPCNRKKGRFAPDDFILSADSFALTCPNGRVSRRRYRSGHEGFTFHFIAPQCLGCPFLQPCRGHDKPPTTRKSIFISDYRSHWDALTAYAQTDAFKLDMKRRPHVERIIAALVLHNGARRARFRGQKKVDFQAKMCATACNLKRWVTLLRNKPQKKRRRLGAPLPTQGGVGLMPT